MPAIPGMQNAVAAERICEDASIVPGPVEAFGSSEEGRQIGHVRWSTYAAYISAVGPLLTIVIVTSLLLMQVSQTFLAYATQHVQDAINNLRGTRLETCKLPVLTMTLPNSAMTLVC